MDTSNRISLRGEISMDENSTPDWTGKEYIGITGFKTLDEISAAAHIFTGAGITKGSNLTVMYGFLMSAWQLKEKDICGARNPALKDLPALLNAVPEGMMPTIHYCSRPRTFDLKNIAGILNYGGIAKQPIALQLNLDWPEPSGLKELKEMFPGIYLIQLINPTLQTEHETIRKAISYAGIVDKLLIDPSLGAGIEYDAKQTARIINKISEETSLFSYVVCGGLDENNVHGRIVGMKKLMRENTYFDAGQEMKFSIDAEGRLRSEDGKKLDLYKTAGYINEAVSAFRGR
jgi:hypothetical protein